MSLEDATPVSGPAGATPDIVLSTHDRDRLAVLVQLRTGLGDEVVELLDQEISRARVVPPQQMPPQVATMDARLRFLDREAGAERLARLAWPGAEDDDPPALSVLTLTGCALLGLSRGQSICWRTGAGDAHVTLLEVLSSPSRRQWLRQLRPRRRRLFGLFGRR